MARLLSSGIFQSGRGLDEVAEAEYMDDWLDLGIDAEVEIMDAIDTAVSVETSTGLSTGGIMKLKQLLTEYKDVLRIRLGPYPPVKVEAMKMKLKNDAFQFMAKPRRLTAEQRGFITKYVGMLE